jgi:hypothetical protein
LIVKGCPRQEMPISAIKTQPSRRILIERVTMERFTPSTWIAEAGFANQPQDVGEQFLGIATPAWKAT